LNDVLWSTAPGGEQGAVFQAILDPSSGQLEYTAAGATDAYILRPHGWEPLVEDAAPLGIEPVWTGAAYCQQIHAGDVLLVISDRHLSRHEAEEDFGVTALAETLLRHMHLSARELADLAVQLIVRQCPEPWGRSILVIKRGER
jgi:serine phosphatase RsbU (regulator of sigma subunit)